MSDEEYLSLAQSIAQKMSDDPKAKLDARAGVGAVLVDQQNQVFSSANEFPAALKGVLNVVDPDSPTRYHYIEHAERSVLFRASAAGAKLDGSVLYCTRFPCSDCARAIIAFRVQRIVVGGGGFDGDGRWIESQRAARHLLKSAGVKIRYL